MCSFRIINLRRAGPLPPPVTRLREFDRNLDTGRCLFNSRIIEDEEDGRGSKIKIRMICKDCREIFNTGRKCVSMAEVSNLGDFLFGRKGGVVYFGYKSIVHACDASQWLDMHSVCIKRSRRRAREPQTLFPRPARSPPTPPSTDSAALLYCELVYETGPPSLSTKLCYNGDISSSEVDSSLRKLAAILEIEYERWIKKK